MKRGSKYCAHQESYADADPDRSLSSTKTESYNHALFQTIVAALEQNGHEVATTDLYRERFDPVMSPDERRSYYEASYDNAGISAETGLLRRTDGIIFCFPHCWFSMPPMLKGYFDRV
jgi:NAD(P)H dehydrogenase (quinone)